MRLREEEIAVLKNSLLILISILAIINNIKYVLL